MEIKSIKRTPYSSVKMMQDKVKIDMLKDNNFRFAPNNLQVDLEAFCSNDCSFCAYRNSNWAKKGMQFLNKEWAEGESEGRKGKPKGKLIPNVSGLPRSIALDLPRQMKNCNIKAIEITGGGEPTLYPYYDEFIDKLIDNDIEIGLVTHGQNLGEKRIQQLISGNLKWVRFSMDSCTKQTHSKVHGVSEVMFNVSVKNIKRLIELKKNKDTVISISFIIVQDNWNEVFDATRFWKEVGVDAIRFSYEYDADGSKKLSDNIIHAIKLLLESSHKFSNDNFKVFSENYRLNDYYQPNNDFSFCFYQMYTAALTYNGDVYPCCIMKYHKGYELGNIKEKSLKEIFLGDERLEYIKNFDVKKCKPCWLRNKNKLMEQYMQEEPLHAHFT